MKPIIRTYSPIASDADGIALSQTPTGAGNLTIAGALASSGVVTLALAQHVSVSCADADSGRTFTVTGTDSFGQPMTEDIAGSSASITKGAKNFKTITSVSVDAATAGAVTVGILGEFETPWIPLNRNSVPFDVRYLVDIGTATFSVEATLDNVQDPLVTPIAITTTNSGSSDVSASLTSAVSAIRVKATSYTSGTIGFKVLQAG